MAVIVNTERHSTKKKSLSSRRGVFRLIGIVNTLGMLPQMNICEGSGLHELVGDETRCYMLHWLCKYHSMMFHHMYWMVIGFP